MTTTPAFDSPTIPFSTAVAALPSAEPAPSAPRPSTSGEARFDERINAVLRGAIEGLGFVAAEVRLVDEQATEIRTSHHQTTDDWTFEPTATMPLADAAGELAAMSGAAVVLEDAPALEDWEIDRSVGAAVCVPIASDTTVHGALWFYSAEPMEIDQPRLQLAEIIAGRIAVEHERHWLLEQERYRETAPRRTPFRRPTSAGRRSAAPHQATAPTRTAPAPDGVDTTGATNGRAHAMHLEQRLDDGRTLMMTGAIVDSPGMTDHDTQTIRQVIAAAIDQHAGDACDAGELLTAVGRQLWRGTTGGDAVSMAIALADDETGEATVALAGDAAALRVQAARRTPLATDLPPIGWDDDAVYPSHAFKLTVRERLVLAIGAARQTGEETADQMASGFRAATADQHRQMTARETLVRASAAPQAEGAPLMAASVLRLS